MFQSFRSTLTLAVFTFVCSSCADPVVGSWSVTSWVSETTTTNCENVTTGQSHAASAAGTLTFNVDGVIARELNQALDETAVYGDASPFSLLDQPQIDSGHWERDEQGISFCFSEACGSIDMAFPSLNNAALLAPVNVSILEPCGEATFSYLMQLRRE